MNHNDSHFKQSVDFEKLKLAGTLILEAIGDDPHRTGVVDTPARFAKSWVEFIDYDAGKTETAFPIDRSGASDEERDTEVDNDQMVVVSGMRVWSMCEHHLIPFWADISVGYIAHNKILGLSKFARIAHKFAHRLQVQEQLVRQIRDEVVRVTGSPDVAVQATGTHLCMVMRGVRTDGRMTSSAMSGAFRADRNTKHEFLELIKR